jgi:hypothetical protein
MRAGVWLLYEALLAGSVLGCSVLGATKSLEDAEAFRCQSDSECSAGHCLSAFGICSANSGGLSTLLFEVTPPASDPIYGGARFLTVLNLDDASAEGLPDRGISPGWLELNVRPRVPVTGSVAAAPNQTACLSRALSTLPVTLTFTPRERLYGLAVASYDLTTTFGSDGLNEYTFRGSLPPGHYDVYMRPDTSALGEDCIAIPQIFRDRSIGASFPLAQPPPRPLALTIPWSADLEGWLLDMVHPVTGEVISNRVHLSALNVDASTQTLKTTLYYSRADTDPTTLPADGFIADADELVRLTPPPSAPDQPRRAGTILLQRSGIELATQGEGVIGNVFEFGEPVDFQSWVWLEDQFDKPVPGTVSFAARDLDEVADGVLASFDGSATVNDQGQIRLSLLPGRYRVRVMPPGIEVPNLGLLSGFESSVTVWANDSASGLVQGGHVIEVPPAVTLSGQVVTRADGAPLAGVEIRANASNTEQDPCPMPGDEQSAVPCDRPGTAVLRKALAQDPFVPRTRTSLSEPDGSFAISGLDCGQCVPGAGARFDLSVRPPPELGLPWLVRRSYNLYSNESILIPLRVPNPVAHAVRLTYGDPAADGQARGLPGALVRVFALLDERDRVITDNATQVPCVSAAVGQHCVQSLVQVAELRSGSDGEFPLLLPPELE